MLPKAKWDIIYSVNFSFHFSEKADTIHEIIILTNYFPYHYFTR